jgi:hypothetical protein
MMNVGNYIQVKICQYFLILDDMYQKIQQGEDTW